ncbi:GPW/gp25 family protein [Helicobacter sp. UBA3407]|uniref:GPW/gp25 family protein n=1 Tax=Helicobacter TaxID=209 RepID=UPI00261359B7|nr:GPW/gp25 family protein [Helicobacter sp. UBA3407]
MSVFYQASLEESIKRILETPLGSRVMLPEFGSRLHTLIDRKMDESFKLDFYRFTAEAIEKWEKRVKLERVSLENIEDSKVHYTLYFEDNSSFSGVLNV